MSVIRDLCVGSVQGKGVDGYRDALELLKGALEPMTAVRRRPRRPRWSTCCASASSTRLLVTNLVNVRCLTGFTGTNGACVVTPEERLFLTDFRYVEQAEEQVRGLRALPAGRDLVGDLAARLRGRAGFDDAHVSVRTHAQARREGGRGRGAGRRRAAWWRAAGGQGRTASSQRDRRGGASWPTRCSSACSSAAWRAAPSARWRWSSSASCATRAPRTRRSRRSWPRAPHGALPHAEPREVEIPPGTLVVVDWGARLDGYCSDCTRTFATGRARLEARREVYELVRRAQEQALGRCAPGPAAARWTRSRAT